MGSDQERLLRATQRRRQQSRAVNNTEQHVPEPTEPANNISESAETPYEKRRLRITQALHQIFGRVISNGNKYIVSDIAPPYEHTTETEELNKLIQTITRSVTTVKAFEPTARPGRYRIII